MKRHAQSIPISNPNPTDDAANRLALIKKTEKEREQLNVAARSRRRQESEIFMELATYLPQGESKTSHLWDRAAVMRLSLSELKLRQMMENVPIKPEKVQYLADYIAISAMGGFLIVLSSNGDIAYVSDCVTEHLGIFQAEVMGHNIYDFGHPSDLGDIRELLSTLEKEQERRIHTEVDDDEIDELRLSCCFRMKCSIFGQGRTTLFRTTDYKVITLIGRILRDTRHKDVRRSPWFIGVGEPILHPFSINDKVNNPIMERIRNRIPLINKQSFLTIHSPDMKCNFVDGAIELFLGYTPQDLIGTSIYELHHAVDGLAIASAFKTLFVKGQCMTKKYRFLAKYGGWAWITTQATLIQCSREGRLTVVCNHFVISGIENSNEIVSYMQQERPWVVEIRNSEEAEAVASVSYPSCDDGLKEDLLQELQDSPFTVFNEGALSAFDFGLSCSPVNNQSMSESEDKPF